MTRRRRASRVASRALLVASTFAALITAGRAHADPKAPGYVQNKFALPCAPSCTLCHANDRGGFANYRTITINGTQKGGFGVTMKNLGFVPTDQSTWDPAFALAEQDKTDTDEDGVPDVEELKADEDPNNPEKGAALCAASDDSSGGCGTARGAPENTLVSASTGAVLMLGVALRRTVRRGSGGALVSTRRRQ
jgi:hypothetical protein